jgi:hypothetical protein
MTSPLYCKSQILISIMEHKKDDQSHPLIPTVVTDADSQIVVVKDFDMWTLLEWWWAC